MKSTQDTERQTLNILFGAFILLLVVLFISVLSLKPPAERIVLLSFDVEPIDGKQSVVDVLNVLSRHNVTATFFVTGAYAEENPEIVRLMKGHEVACHSYSHPYMTKLDYEEKKDEIVRCRELLEEITGKQVVGYRAPYHFTDDETYEILDELGFVYDATVIKGLGWIFPDVHGYDIGEIPVSSVMMLPVEDVVWNYYLHLNPLYFYILRNKDSELESYLFHPREIVKELDAFEDAIKTLKMDNTIFISHIGLINARSEDEGV